MERKNVIGGSKMKCECTERGSCKTTKHVPSEENLNKVITQIQRLIKYKHLDHSFCNAYAFQQIKKEIEQMD
jgi:hypothetical protein